MYKNSTKNLYASSPSQVKQIYVIQLSYFVLLSGP